MFGLITVSIIFMNNHIFSMSYLEWCGMQVLDYCKASPKDYKCIFTSGATAALKLVGEAFPWSHQSSFVYTTENHNSVLGIREYPSEWCLFDITFLLCEQFWPPLFVRFVYKVILIKWRQFFSEDYDYPVIDVHFIDCSVYS